MLVSYTDWNCVKKRKQQKKKKKTRAGVNRVWQRLEQRI